MSGFNLSPGITPLITDVAFAGFALSFGICFALFQKSHPRAIFIALGIDSIALSVFKIYTDYLDFWDVVLSVFILTEGLMTLSVPALENRSILLRLGIYVVVGLGIAFSLYKVLSDFYDPYDLLLSCCGIVCGIAIAKATSTW
jgi:hypothetical protein